MAAFVFRIFSFISGGSGDVSSIFVDPTLTAVFLFVRVKKELLPLARSLCQDVEFEVRACMCRQLESIARATW